MVKSDINIRPFFLSFKTRAHEGMNLTKFTFDHVRSNNSAFKDVIIDLIAGSIGATGRKISKAIIFAFNFI